MNVNRRRRKPLLGRAPRLTNIQHSRAHTTYGGRMGDRAYKIPLYVSAGVPSWIVNIAQRQIEYYATPDNLARPHGRVATESETIEILGVSIPVAGLFGDQKP